MSTATAALDNPSAAAMARPGTVLESPMPVAPPSTSKPRLVSLDVYRGFVMMLMASESLGIPSVASHFRDNRIWQLLAYETEHVTWTGCALWDLIQPSFTFIVGVAMPFSLANRRAKGQTFPELLRHAVVRSLILVALGIFIRSFDQPRTNFMFTDTLAQIGLGYTFLFLLAWTTPRTQALTMGLILLAYWLAFALYPLPPAGFDYSRVGVPQAWQHLHGFAAHWDKNTNFAAAFDTWFMNLFPRVRPFHYEEGGYQTLNFIPTLSTMIAGLLSGNLMKSERAGGEKFMTLVLAGIAGLCLGTLLDRTGLCPSVKRIWTPSWVLFSGGWCCLLLAAFHYVIDLRGWRRWAFPFIVVGMNSIAMYMLADGARGYIRNTLRIHLGQHIFDLFGPSFAPMTQTGMILLILWLICWWMYRRKIFLRI